MRILVTGASGLLGLNLCLMKGLEHQVFGIAHRMKLKNVPFTVINKDLTRKKAIEDIFDNSRPELVINCAAMANVDQCERFQKEAEVINSEVPGRIAQLCADRSIPFVHISTDAVFDGKKGNYSEEDETNPLSIYAKTKLEGEKRVLESNQNALIARVNFFGFSITGKRSLAEFFLSNLLMEKKIHGFTDIFFSPLYVRDLIKILFAMIEKHLTGIFHVASCDFLSKYEFGILISKQFDLKESLISPVSYKKGGLPAKRSPNLVLNINKLQKSGIQVPEVASGIEKFHLDYQDGLSRKIQSFARI